MLISTSFLSSMNPARELKLLNETDTDYIHVDVMDGIFVPGRTMPFKEMRKIYKYTSKRLDVHLMVEDASKLITKYANLNAEYITIHVERENVEQNLKLIKEYAIKAGIAINPETKVKELVPYLPLVDLILVMSVEPGKGGQAFLPKTKNKIKEISYNFSLDDTEFITNKRQQDCLVKCRESLTQALEAAKIHQLQDLISIDLKSALLFLDEITGEVITDDILNNIFDHFCIGK